MRWEAGWGVNVVLVGWTLERERSRVEGRVRSGGTLWVGWMLCEIYGLGREGEDSLWEPFSFSFSVAK